jgi:hypothetical protein
MREWSLFLFTVLLSGTGPGGAGRCSHSAVQLGGVRIIADDDAGEAGTDIQVACGLLHSFFVNQVPSAACSCLGHLG